MTHSPFVTPSQVSREKYPFAIMGEKPNDVRGICQTHTEAVELANLLTRTNGGTATIVDRRSEVA